MSNKKIGRPTKLTPELQEKICGFIRQGNYISTACLACGVTQRTYERWIVAGEEEKDVIYVAFVEAIKKAEADAEAADIKVIDAASVHSWQAAAWKLERKNPQKWGRRERLEHTGIDEKPIKIEIITVKSKEEI